MVLVIFNPQGKKNLFNNLHKILYSKKEFI